MTDASNTYYKNILVRLINVVDVFTIQKLFSEVGRIKKCVFISVDNIEEGDKCLTKTAIIPSKEFPKVRVFGSIGWVASGLFSIVFIHLFGMDFDGTNRFVGLGSAKLILKKFNSIEKIKNANIEELISVDGVGVVIAESLCDFLDDTVNYQQIMQMG